MDTILLREIAEVASGQGAPQGEKYFGSEGYPFIRAGSLEYLTRGGNEETLEKITADVAKRFKLRLFPKGTVLFAKSGMSATKDRIYVLQSLCYVVSHLAAIIPKDAQDSLYLKFWFKKFNPSKLIKDKGYPSIRLSDIEKLKIPNIPKETKNELTAILQNTELALKKRDDSIQLSNKIALTIFMEMFGDPLTSKQNIKQLSEVCSINPRAKIHVPDDTEVSFVPMSAVSENGSIDTSQVRRYCEVKKGYTPFIDGDVLFAKITPCMENGKGAIARNLKNEMGFGSTEFHVLRPSKEIVDVWLYHLLSFKHFREIAAKSMTGTAGQQRVPTSFLERLKISVPLIVEQQKFADLICNIDKLKTKQHESLGELDTLFNSAMQQAFLAV